MSSRPQAPTTSALEHSTSNGQLSQSTCAKYTTLYRLSNGLQCRRDTPQHASASRNLPAISQDRLDNSLTDLPYNLEAFYSGDLAEKSEKDKTVLYLAYGSNLCDETFLGRRGIKPISQTNVLVPELRLTFDLPGVPYNEPCFANTARRDPTESLEEETRMLGADTADYRKDRWKKGLVGTVYEVSLKDYAHIIATEGGGAGYHDIVVTCYPLPTSPTVPKSPSTPPFKSHTLFAPAEELEDEGRLFRPDPAYAQPSARYLKLITDGAVERNLPAEYREYLENIRTYTITQKKQKMGQFLFTAIWMPILSLFLGLAAKYQDDKGRNPEWLVHIFAVLFNTMWSTYDGFFKPTFGDGERTQKRKDDEDNDDGCGRRRWRARGEKSSIGYEQC